MSSTSKKIIYALAHLKHGTMVTYIVEKVKEYSRKIKKNVRKNEKANVDSVL